MQQGGSRLSEDTNLGVETAEHEPQPSPKSEATALPATRSDEEMAAWEELGDHSLAATLLYRMGLPQEPLLMKERAERASRLKITIEPPYTTERIMDTIAQLTKDIAHSTVDLKQANTILYALQTLLTASRVQLQEKQAEARAQPRQHLHVHQHQQLPSKERTPCPEKISEAASADTPPRNTPKSIMGRIAAGGDATQSRAEKGTPRWSSASAPGSGQPPGKLARSGTGKRTRGRKKPPHRAG